MFEKGITLSTMQRSILSMELKKIEMRKGYSEAGEKIRRKLESGSSISKSEARELFGLLESAGFSNGGWIDPGTLAMYRLMLSFK